MEGYRQLMIDPETGDICEGMEHIPDDDTREKPVVNKCKHNVKIKAFKQDYISYCSKCGKFLSVRKRKEHI